MADLIVQTGVKEELTDHNVSAELYDALDQKVAALFENAARRADANVRKTVQPHDL